MTKIGLIGCGMWGRNLARNLAQLDALHCVADLSPANADAFAAQFDTVALSVDDLIANKEIVGVALATSAPSHVALGIRVLAAGKHLYVEKPLTLTLADALEIEAAANAANKQVMVGHLIRYHAAFQELQSQVTGGAIGQLRHVQANRLAMGRIRNTESVLFDLCPHDLSLILALMGGAPIKVACAGVSHVTPGVVDVLSTTLGFSEGRSANMQTSWISPYKEHRLTVSGSAGSLVFDDTKSWPEKLTLFQDHIRPDGEGFVIERASPISLPVSEGEPLKDEMRTFIACCAQNQPAPTDINEALRVQRVLEDMQSVLTDTNTP